MTKKGPGGLGQKFLQIAVTYSLWALSAGFALFALLWVRILLFVDLPLVVFMIDPWVQRAIDRIGTIILGLGWLIFAVVSESYFRRLYDQSNRTTDILRVFGAEAILLVISYGIHLLIG